MENTQTAQNPQPSALQPQSESSQNPQTPPTQPQNPPQNSGQPPVEPKKGGPLGGLLNGNNKKKLIIWSTAIGTVLIFLLIISLVFGEQISNIGKVQPTPTPVPVVKATPTPDPTAEWRVYGNEKYGYQISYPHEFTYEVTQKEEGYFEFSEFTDFKNYTRTTRLSNPNSTNITILSMYTGNITSVADWIKNEGSQKAPEGTIGPNIVNVTSTSIAQEDAVVYEDGDTFKRKSVVFYNDGRLILFSLVPTTEGEGTYSDIRESVVYFDNLLSTFRFTDLTFIPISSTLSFDLPDGWEITSESRDRIQISDGTENLVFYKSSGLSRAQLEKDAKTRITHKFRTGSLSLNGKSGSEFTGCKSSEECELIHIISIIVGKESYQIIYEDSDENPVFTEILNSIKFN